MARIDLTGKPIVITGASSGIGAATAIECARAGMPVALGARRTDKLEAVADQIRATGGRVLVMSVDVTQAEQCRALVDACASEFGSVYGVYANAGYGEEAPLHSMDEARIRAMFETNYFGSLHVIRPAVERMLKNPGPHRGHVLWCSSCLARMGLPNYSIYCATKSAQALGAWAMRHELKHEGVRVTSVHPIGTRTEFFDQVKERSGGKRLTFTTPNFMYQPAELVARKTVGALRRPRAEVWTGMGTLVRIGMALAVMWPEPSDWALGKIHKG